MSRENWEAAVAKIQAVTGPVTRDQKRLAEIAGLKLPENLPQLVAGAQLQIAFSNELGLVTDVPAVEIQYDIIADLETRAYRALPAPTDRREADAWIEFLRLKRRERALKRLKLDIGDIVEVDKAGEGAIAEVSSIGSNGRIYFKGGGGFGAWPDMVKVRARKHDGSSRAGSFRQKAANGAAHRARTDSWSESKERELESFAVDIPITKEIVDQFQEVLDAARDEKPIQNFIEAYPQILTALLGGRRRFLLSRSSLGGQYIPDFLIADTDSLGIRWLLVELETPNSTVTLRRKNDLEANARNGVNQVKEWREWLQSNLDYARRTRRENGLGLVDIRPRSEGLVLVGRRSLLHGNSTIVRNPIREESNIRIHTYDWLLERLSGILTFSGPPAGNRYLIAPLRDRRNTHDDF